MYIPKYFSVKDEKFILGFMEKNSFGILLTANGEEVMNSHIPILVGKNGDDIVLRGHLATENNQWEKSTDHPVSILFLGPHHYISPRWYKDESSVPTWNYAVVKATGIFKILSRVQAEKLLVDLSRKFDQEWSSRGKEKELYYQKMVDQIVAFQIKVDLLEAKWKMSQNRPKEDIPIIVHELQEINTELSLETASEIKKQNHNRIIK